MADKQLTAQESAFVSALLRGLGKAEAAIEAGYSAKSAHVYATKLLARPHIKAALDEFYSAEAWQTRIDRERIRRKLMDMAMAEPAEVFDEDFELLPKSKIPKGAKALILSARTWDTPDQGRGSQVKCASPIEAMKVLLKHFPLVEENSSDSEEAENEALGAVLEMVERTTGETE